MRARFGYDSSAVIRYCHCAEGVIVRFVVGDIDSRIIYRTRAARISCVLTLDYIPAVAFVLFCIVGMVHGNRVNAIVYLNILQKVSDPIAVAAIAVILPQLRACYDGVGCDGDLYRAVIILGGLCSQGHGISGRIRLSVVGGKHQGKGSRLCWRIAVVGVCAFCRTVTDCHRIAQLITVRIGEYGAEVQRVGRANSSVGSGGGVHSII